MIKDLSKQTTYPFDKRITTSNGSVNMYVRDGGKMQLRVGEDLGDDIAEADVTLTYAEVHELIACLFGMLNHVYPYKGDKPTGEDVGVSYKDEP